MASFAVLCLVGVQVVVLALAGLVVVHNHRSVLVLWWALEVALFVLKCLPWLILAAGLFYLVGL